MDTKNKLTIEENEILAKLLFKFLKYSNEYSKTDEPGSIYAKDAARLSANLLDFFDVHLHKSQLATRNEILKNLYQTEEI